MKKKKKSYRISVFRLHGEEGCSPFRSIAKCLAEQGRPTEEWRSASGKAYQIAEASLEKASLNVRWRRVVRVGEDEQVHAGEPDSTEERLLALPGHECLLHSCHAALDGNGLLAFQENRDCGSLNQFCAHLRKVCGAAFKHLPVLDDKEYLALASGELTARRISLSFDMTDQSAADSSTLLGFGPRFAGMMGDALERGTMQVSVSQRPGFDAQRLMRLLAGVTQETARTCKVDAEELDHPVDILLRRRVDTMTLDLSEPPASIRKTAWARLRAVLDEAVSDEPGN